MFNHTTTPGRYNANVLWRQGGLRPLMVAASADAAVADTDTEITFTVDSVTGGSGTYTYAWTFTGGDTDTGSPAMYTWASPGAKAAVVVVTDAVTGQTGRATVPVAVYDPIEVTVSVSPPSGPYNSPAAVTYSAAVTGGSGTFTYAWEFTGTLVTPDIDDSTDEAPEVTWTGSTGDHTATATLVVTDAESGLTAEDDLDITVTDAGLPPGVWEFTTPSAGGPTPTFTPDESGSYMIEAWGAGGGGYAGGGGGGGGGGYARGDSVFLSTESEYFYFVGGGGQGGVVGENDGYGYYGDPSYFNDFFAAAGGGAPGDVTAGGAPGGFEEGSTGYSGGTGGTGSGSAGGGGGSGAGTDANGGTGGNASGGTPGTGGANPPGGGTGGVGNGGNGGAPGGGGGGGSPGNAGGAGGNGKIRVTKL